MACVSIGALKEAVFLSAPLLTSKRLPQETAIACQVQGTWRMVDFPLVEISKCANFTSSGVPKTNL